MNKKIVFSAVSIVSSLGLMVGATFANFSSTASNTGNTFGSGTLVLAINGLAALASSHVFTVPNAVPGYSQTQVLDLSNTGSVNAGSTTLTGISVTPHATGDLGDALTLTLYRDDGNGIYDAGDTQIATGHLVDPVWNNLNLGFGLLALGNHKVFAVLTFDSGAGDSYQGKSVSFDFNFQANQ